MFNPFKKYPKTTYTATALTAVAAGVVFSPVAVPAMAITAAQAVLATAAAAVAGYSVYAVGLGLLNLGRGLMNKFKPAETTNSVVVDKDDVSESNVVDALSAAPAAAPQQNVRQRRVAAPAPGDAAAPARDAAAPANDSCDDEQRTGPALGN